MTATGEAEMDGPTTRKPSGTPFSEWAVLAADDADGVRWFFYVPTAALAYERSAGAAPMYGDLDAALARMAANKPTGADPSPIDVERIVGLAVRFANHGTSTPPHDPCESCALATAEILHLLDAAPSPLAETVR